VYEWLPREAVATSDEQHCYGDGLMVVGRRFARMAASAGPGGSDRVLVVVRIVAVIGCRSEICISSCGVMEDQSRHAHKQVVVSTAVGARGP
jgi:hypothetical protein